jgi:hypothetical protein
MPKRDSSGGNKGAGKATDAVSGKRQNKVPTKGDLRKLKK